MTRVIFIILRPYLAVVALVKAGVVSITIPPRKLDFASTPVLERRTNVPNDVFCMGVRDGRRENISA